MLRTENWGLIHYREAWERQKAYVLERQADQIQDTIVFCEHDPVITLGRGGQRDDSPPLLAPKYEVIPVERGGLATYHGPGQVVGYPIFKLGRKNPLPGRTGVVDLIRTQEKWIVSYLCGLGLQAGVVEGKTGVWIAGERKICSIGIAVSHWVSYHGFALNVSTGSEPWTCFNPCGFSASVMTDVNTELALVGGSTLQWNDVFEGLVRTAPEFFIKSNQDLKESCTDIVDL